MNATHWARLALVLITSLIVQVSVLNEISVAGAHPDVMVLLVVAAGLIGGAQRGSMIGFVVGCAADLVVNTPFGMSPLTFVALGFTCGLLRNVAVGRRTTSRDVVVTGIACAVGTLVFMILGAAIGQKGMFDRSSDIAVLVVGLGAIVMAPVVLPIIRWMFSGTAASRASTAIPTGGSAVG